MTNLKKWYENKAKTYSNFDKLGVKRYSYALKNLDKNLNNCNILDIGCKSGSLLNIINKKYKKFNYQGIDISKNAVNLIPKYKKQNIEIIIKDINKGIPIKTNSIDYLFCLEVIEHLTNPLYTFNEICRVLKKNGVAIISIPNPYFWTNIFDNIFKIPQNEGHLAAFNWTEINTLCIFSGLKITKIKKTFDVIPYSLYKPYKRNKYFTLPAITICNSICNQYFISKK